MPHVPTTTTLLWCSQESQQSRRGEMHSRRAVSKRLMQVRAETSNFCSSISRELVGLFLHSWAQRHCFAPSSQQSGRRKMSLKRQINLLPHYTTPWAGCETRNRPSSSCIYLLSRWTIASLMDSPSCLLCIEDLIYCSRMAEVFKQPHFLFK